MLYGFKLSLLILVLMEYKNTDWWEEYETRKQVLILVLMEYKNTNFALSVEAKVQLS